MMLFMKVVPQSLLATGKIVRKSLVIQILVL